eukprot:CAMPEP_0117650052 /NCGR_PEP_ID=MMETSP0804-20121206/1329_1 /TAXON_ID=1074897 /ORGANISM="Tetraselmis astigmatica, Strain CCMP880" /LENGTH=50 /DNA_ID=CAMNT_0005455889 /DNA_START=731 /DNA_END=879 /DNA_ORIENTATION=+
MAEDDLREEQLAGFPGSRAENDGRGGDIGASKTFRGFAGDRRGMGDAREL